MKEEPDPADGMMTDAEMTYLTTMEEVKDISHNLVIAEKAFTFVRDRIEKLVAKCTYRNVCMCVSETGYALTVTMPSYST